MQFKSLVPMLQTEDLEQTARWYETVLGFQRSGAGEDWCRVSLDGVAIMFMRNAHLGPPHATATQYVQVDDVMALWAMVQPHVPAERGPERMPYGMLEFAVKDPNGYLLSFGQPIGDAA